MWFQSCCLDPSSYYSTVYIVFYSRWLCFVHVEDSPPPAKPKTGEGGGLFGSDDEEGEDLFFTPTKSPTKSLPKLTPSSTSSTHTMTQDQKAALRQVEIRGRGANCTVLSCSLSLSNSAAAFGNNGGISTEDNLFTGTTSNKVGFKVCFNKKDVL